MTVTFEDVGSPLGCNVTLIRTWHVQDDCGNEAYTNQTLRMLNKFNFSQSESPPDGANYINVYLRFDWPEYPGAWRHR